MSKGIYCDLSVLGDWLEKEYDGRNVKRRKLSRGVFSRFNGKPLDLNKQIRVYVFKSGEWVGEVDMERERKIHSKYFHELCFWTFIQSFMQRSQGFLKSL